MGTDALRIKFSFAEDLVHDAVAPFGFGQVTMQKGAETVTETSGEAL